MRRQRLAETLTDLATAADPIKLFYHGERRKTTLSDFTLVLYGVSGGIAQTISAEITEKGGLVTPEDLASYETRVIDSPLESDALPGDYVS